MSNVFTAPAAFGSRVRANPRHVPLRIVRFVEPGQPPGSGARLRLSGRMAEVCAELERLAAFEARG